MIILHKNAYITVYYINKHIRIKIYILLLKKF